MSLHSDAANPSKDGGFVKLLAGIIIFNRNKKPVSALPQHRMFRHVGGVILTSSYWTASIKLSLPSGDPWNN